MEPNDNKIVIIFGVFDMLHPGHVYFIERALEHGNELHICLATDEYVFTYKGKNTRNNYKIRKIGLKNKFPNVIIHKGDDEIGEWSIFKELNPDVIVFGHDQKLLMKTVVETGLAEGSEIIEISPHNSDIYSTTNLSN